MKAFNDLSNYSIEEIQEPLELSGHLKKIISGLLEFLRGF
jgi:hypothetical protein